MKFLVCAFALLAGFACASAFVVPSGFEAPYGSQTVRLADVDSDGGLDASHTDFRQRRDIRCEFISFETHIAAPRHLGCTLKCAGRGYGDGYCEGMTCVCRNDNRVPW